MIKRLIVLACLAVLALGVYNVADAGMKRIDNYQGCDTIVMTGATDSAFKKTDLIPIVKGHSVYDMVLAWAYVPAVTEGLDISGVSGEGNTDTVIGALVSREGYMIDTLAVDTCGSPPCTLTFRYDMMNAYSGSYGDTAIIKNDSSGGGFWFPKDTVYTGLLYENLYIDFYGADSAAHGTGDTLEFIINWWIKLFERE